ncbi:D(3) dopamine receptor-like [Mercenaria mercenaria]|uniref:D(3) dopamine receptor-like n=1 Tax=Mercenaria mercenaria TaxID=6596 RepID=UPI001E1DEBBC|nr:D(3) dopamine receptor-like [Mercenaria mercenaria]
MAIEAYFTTWHIVYIAIIIPTVLGNGLILYSVVTCKSLRCNMHILIANLAVSDLTVGAILIPLDMLADIFQWKYNKYVCVTTLSLFVFSLGSSCFNLLIISIERFIAIVYPFSAKSLLSKPKFVFMITFGWIISILHIATSFSGIGSETNFTECLNTSAWSKAYQTYLDWILVFALVLNGLFYVIVMCIALKKTRTRTISGGLFYVHFKARKDVHQLITMVIVLGMFLVCWMPYATLGVIVTFWDTAHNQFIKRCTLIPGFFNSGINWIIYGYRNREYKKAFKKTLRCCLTMRSSQKDD